MPFGYIELGLQEVYLPSDDLTLFSRGIPAIFGASPRGKMQTRARSEKAFMSSSMDPESIDPHAPGGAIPWCCACLSMALLPLNQALGSISVAIFLLMWIGYVAMWPAHAFAMVGRERLLWIFPGVAVASTLWSIAPEETLRHAIQLALTTFITIVMARSLSLRAFLSALTCALVPIILLSAALGSTQLTETGEVAARGLFGAKNFYALHISLMLFACLGTLVEPRQPLLVRLIAAVGVAAGPILLMAAKSIGTFVTAGPCLVAMLAVLSFTRLRRDLRPIAICILVVVLTMVVTISAVMIVTDKDYIFGLLGKSSNLTGRDFLWYRARFLIAQRPTLGVGYQAFWIQGNLEAEGLWRAEHIANRGGFHFHSYYYGTIVELGYLGFCLITLQYVALAGAVIVWAFRRPGGESAFFCAIVVFYLLRAPVELDFTLPFGLTPLLLPAGWLYAFPRTTSETSLTRSYQLGLENQLRALRR